MAKREIKKKEENSLVLAGVYALCAIDKVNFSKRNKSLV